ncbi:receptor-like protein 43 [Camellia sinensis]|uniref:receptor-like protein 43 n=1 Tax=Camellia sinensis TaxID=4442 RepID=UPI001036F130|nr:receptor-like protein 43 [Camellia sinensis]
MYNSFSGQIPLSISNLAKHTHLFLSNDNLNGQLPDSIGNMSQLAFLNLSRNQLIGPIPLYTIGFSRLTYLDLKTNSLNGIIPSWLFTLPSLVSKELRDNKLQGQIPGSVYELVNLTQFLNSLRVLDLSNINFSGIIPHCLGNFSNSLSVLNLGMNSFHGTFTVAFKKGSMLRNLNLNGNQIEGQVLRALLNSEHLDVLDLGINKINDTFPHWLGTLLELQWPFANELYEKFEAMMNVDEHAMKLKYMGDIYYYDYVVVIMKGHEIEFSRILTILSIIDLSSNKFIGEIPKSVGRLNSLRYLNLSHNNQKDHIPTSLGNLKNLESLDLSSNKFTSLMFLERIHIENNVVFLLVEMLPSLLVGRSNILNSMVIKGSHWRY